MPRGSGHGIHRQHGYEDDACNQRALTVIFATFIVVVGAIAGVGCDRRDSESPEPAQAVSSNSPDNDGTGAAKVEATEAEDESKSAEDRQAVKKEDLPRGEPPPIASLEEAIEDEHERAHAALFETEKCESDRLQRCLDFEENEKWEKAARCYRRTFDEKLMGECRSMQLIESAVHYRRAGTREMELKQWLNLSSRADSPVATVVMADLRLAQGRFEFARNGYSLYLTEDGHSSLNEYVKAQCERLGGCKVGP